MLPHRGPLIGTSGPGLRLADVGCLEIPELRPAPESHRKTSEKALEVSEFGNERRQLILLKYREVILDRKRWVLE